MKTAISSYVLPDRANMTVDCSRNFEQSCMPIALNNQALEVVGIHLNALNSGLVGCF
ncbi:MAG: hypothetical protein ABI180_05780 [Microcoleus sp.]